MTQRDSIYIQLKDIALGDFADIVDGSKIIEGKLRILLKDGSFIDIWISVKKEGVYAYHWERRNINGKIYRYNNLPDREAKKLKTYPKHYHDGTQENIIESNLSDNPEEALRIILEFSRRIIQNV
jgi:hypothetical protein